MVLVRLDETEVRARAGRESLLVIETEGRRLYRIALVDATIIEPVVALALALAADCPNQLHDRVVKIQGQTNRGILRLECVRLILHDKHLVLECCKLVPLGSIEIDVASLKACTQSVRTQAACRCTVLHQYIFAGHDDELFERTPHHMHLDSMELK